LGRRARARGRCAAAMRAPDAAVAQAPATGRKQRVLVAGGGIGGLVFALAARRKGYDVTVFERDLSAVRGEGQYRGGSRGEQRARRAGGHRHGRRRGGHARRLRHRGPHQRPRRRRLRLMVRRPFLSVQPSCSPAPFALFSPLSYRTCRSQNALLRPSPLARHYQVQESLSK
jgi:hypothetical protein